MSVFLFFLYVPLLAITASSTIESTLTFDNGVTCTIHDNEFGFVADSICQNCENYVEGNATFYWPCDQPWICDCTNNAKQKTKTCKVSSDSYETDFACLECEYPERYNKSLLCPPTQGVCSCTDIIEPEGGDQEDVNEVDECVVKNFWENNQYFSKYTTENVEKNTFVEGDEIKYKCKRRNGRGTAQKKMFCEGSKFKKNPKNPTDISKENIC